MIILYNKEDNLSIEKIQKVTKNNKKILRKITKRRLLKKQKTSFLLV